MLFSPRSVGQPASRPRRRVWIVAAAAVLLALALVAVACGGSSNSGGPDPNPGPDPMGRVKTAPTVDCSSVGDADQGVPNGTCYVLTVACPDVADEGVAVKVNAPVGDSKGTILFSVGGAGTPWYDVHFAFGTQLINSVRDAGFTTVQFNFMFPPTGFPDGGLFAGWLTGPGGPRKLACRWATAAQWVHDNIRAGNTAFCATGNSAGSAAAAYALAHYGMGSVFNMLEETSGPPFTRLDHGCICDQPPVQTVCGQGALSECYHSDGNAYVDPAYNPLGHICSSAEDSHDTTNKQKFINDSIMAPDATTSFPNTDIHFVFGGLDDGAAEPQAMIWIPTITAKSSIPVDCVADAPHMIADVQDGAEKIAHDLITSCHQ